MFLDKTALLFGICVAVLFSGCGSVTGPKFSEFKQPTNGNAMVYIYNNLRGGGNYFISYDDINYNFGHVGYGFVKSKEVPANKEIKIWTRGEIEASEILDTSPNESYCLKAGYALIGWVGPRPNLQKVDMQTCAKDIANLRDTDSYYAKSYENKEKFNLPSQGKSMLYIGTTQSDIDTEIIVSDGAQEINLSKIKKK